MRLIDAHCHLESSAFQQDLDDVLDAARAAGVVHCLTCATTPGQWERSRALAARYPGVSCALGVHPWHQQPGDLERVEALRHAREWGAAAIGEIGLDSKIDRPSLEEQLPLFRAQLVVARDLDLPVNLHCRGAFNEMLAVLADVGAPRAGGVLHNFTGSRQLASQFMAHGLCFSLGGVLTYRNSRKRAEMLRHIWPGAFVLETDSPDIPPVALRGQRNVPAHIRYNLTAAAEILEVSEETVAETTTENALRIFNLEG